MQHALFVITGTSRGIGDALARNLLQQGHSVVGVSRSGHDLTGSANFHHLPFDLTRTSRVGEIMDKVEAIFTAGRFNFVCLVNNASAVDPVGPIEKGPAEQIEAHLAIGLVSPMLLTSRFIQRFTGEAIRKKVAFISSGAAHTPLPDESVYCTAKAGLHMFARCVGLEQKDRSDGFEVVSIGPGMVDTAMQLAVRSKSSDEFAMADFFRQAFAEGRLQDPDAVAGKILSILEGRFEQGQYVSVTDV
jgi:benzil reductase ((S)-benzoin forming)